MKFWPLFCLLVLVHFSCSEEQPIVEVTNPVNESGTMTLSGLDLSALPEIEASGITFFDEQEIARDFLDMAKASGVNMIRLRLWVDPATEHSSYEEVLTYAQTLKEKGFGVWLCLHYSDSWADPGQQNTPAAWANLSYEALRDTLYSYTNDVVSNIQPDMVQVGNEINTGILHPIGHIDNLSAFRGLLQAGIEGVRDWNADIPIMLHYAGYSGATYFYEQMVGLDYDQIGLSYYPKFHGMDIALLRSTLDELSTIHQKDMVIAETAYPFTLGWNDYTNNIVGLEEQLLPGYEASPSGQLAFIQLMKDMILSTEGGLGICYWGAELIAWKGPEATDGSPWENQAVFDFDRKKLPVLDEFK